MDSYICTNNVQHDNACSDSCLWKGEFSSAWLQQNATMGSNLILQRENFADEEKLVIVQKPNSGTPSQLGSQSRYQVS